MVTTAYDEVTLTTNEQEQIRAQAIRIMRARLEQQRPTDEHYSDGTVRAGRLIASVLFWSKAFIPVVALLAALASSVRTVQTASEIYTASGSHPLGVVTAAIAFTLSVEGALFVLALAQEGERMALRALQRPRHVLSLRNLWRGILVRLGMREPLRYDEVNGETNLTSVMLIALIFAVSANLYLGMRPVIDEVGAVSLQTLLQALWTAPAELQLTFLVDLAGVLFPPLMALAAGHLTARFAAEFAEQTRTTEDELHAARTAWRAAYSDPLASAEGQSLLEGLLEEKQRAKRDRRAGRQTAGQAATGLKNGALHWKEADWTPTPETYECACGCGEAVTWQGIGRRPLYVNDAHRKRHLRRQQRANSSAN